MHANWIRTLALTAVLGGAGLLFGQGQSPTGDPNKVGDPKTGQPVQPPDKANKEAPKADKDAPKTKLEEMLQQAMRNNADIRVAEAKLATAEAEANRTRLVVMQKVILYNANYNDAKAKVALAESKMKRMSELSRRAAVSKEIVDEAEIALQAAKAELAKVEAELPMLLGIPGAAKTRGLERWRRATLDLYDVPNLRPDVTGELTLDPQSLNQYAIMTQTPSWQAIILDLKHPVQGPMVDRIKKALDLELKVSFQNQSTRDALDYLLQQVEGVPYKIQLTAKELGPETVDFTLNQEVPLGAVFQALQDSVSPNVRFVVRDYGILVTDDKHVPPGAPLLYDVWKGGKEKAKTTATQTPVKVEGVVKEVDEKAGMVSISVGSDAGLKKGDKLAVIHTGPKVKGLLTYVAQIRIVELTATEAVGKRTDDAKAEAIKAGDTVTNQLPEK